MSIVPPGTELAPRNPGVKPWSELSEKERQFAARLQEAFAAMLDHADTQVGRLVDCLEEIGALDDTLFILVSDNGASQEGGPLGVFDETKYFNMIPEDIDQALYRLDEIGGPNSHCNIPWGWAQAGNTPLKWYKQNTHGGGVRDPLIVRWPRRIRDAGGLRRQFCHAIDIAPTVLEAIGLAPPEKVAGVEQIPIHGVSLAPTFSDARAMIQRGAQYFEMLGHRGLWKDGWKAVTHHIAGAPFGEDEWELYHLDDDFSETRDLAAAEPERLKSLIDEWWVQAEANGVLPLDDRRSVRRRLCVATVKPADLAQSLRLPPAYHAHRRRCLPTSLPWLACDCRYGPFSRLGRRPRGARQREQRVYPLCEGRAVRLRLQRVSCSQRRRR